MHIDDKRKEMDLKAWPIVREILFYLLGLLAFLCVIQDGQMTFNEAGISLGIYAFYVLGVLFVFWYYPDTVGGDSKDIDPPAALRTAQERSKIMQVESSVSNSAAKECDRRRGTLRMMWTRSPS